IPYSEVTPKNAYMNRRTFLAAAGVAGTGLAAAKLIPEMLNPAMTTLAGTKLEFKKSDLSTHGEELTPLKDITTYNHFYEFGTSKGDPAIESKDFKTSPWTVSIEGLVKKPQKLDVASILKLSPLEESVYRMRC